MKNTYDDIEKVNGIWIPKGDEFFKENLKKDHVFQRSHLKRSLSHMKVDFKYAYDIGAHVGTWSVFLAGLFEKVIAFEPCKLNYECLVKNTSKYSNVYTYNLALSNTHRHNEVLFSGYRNSGMHYLNRDVNIDENKHTVLEYINTSPLDDMISTNSNIMKEPSFIKIDVEGHEYEVLKGMNRTLTLFKGVIVVEEGPNTNPGKVPSHYLVREYGFEKVDKIKDDIILIKQ